MLTNSNSAPMIRFALISTIVLIIVAEAIISFSILFGRTGIFALVYNKYHASQAVFVATSYASEIDLMVELNNSSKIDEK